MTRSEQLTPAMNRKAPLRIGALARLAGISVRALRHYETLGLLTPAGRSSAGYRLYDQQAVARLLRIKWLKSLGLSLGEIGARLKEAEQYDGREPDLRQILLEQRRRIELKLEQNRRLLERIEQIEGRLSSRATFGDTIEVLEIVSTFEKYYTPQQMERLKRRGEMLGAETIEAVQREWPQLIAEVKAAMAAGKVPEDPEVRALAARWQELVEMFTGGDPGITRSLASYYRGEPGATERAGFDSSISAFVKRALSSGREQT